MVITTSQIRDLLWPGLDAIFGELPDFPPQWKEIFEAHTSDKQYEKDVEVKLLGLADFIAEGQSVPYEDMGERYTYTYLHKGVGLGFIMTKYAIRDNLYKSQFGPNTRALKHSFLQTKETYGAAVLNNATDTNYLGGDGKPLLSTTHPIDTGYVANTPIVQTELNETSLQDSIVRIRRFRDAAGLRKMVKPRKLVTTPEMSWIAERLMGSNARPGRVGTNDNDLNAIRSMGVLPGGYTINDFLTNTKSWYVTTECPNGLKFFQRDPLEIDLYTDFDTSNLKCKGEERYSFGWSDFRGIDGAMPT